MTMKIRFSPFSRFGFISGILFITLLFSPCLSAAFTDNGDGTISDPGTGFVWQQRQSTTKLTWTEAVTYCENLTLGGFSDWRLPEMTALITLADYSTYSPSINSLFFADSVEYWSASQVADTPSRAWVIDFVWGETGYGDVDTPLYTRCVRGNTIAPPEPSVNWRIENDDVLYDGRTNLYWERRDESGIMTLEEAKIYCNDLTKGAYDDWRLPTIQEFQTILNFSDQAYPDGYFKFLNTYYWTKTPLADLPDGFWAVDHSAGYNSRYMKDSFWGARCVRGDELTVQQPDNGATLEFKILADKLNGEPPLTIHFSATIDGGTPPYFYEWDFGDSIIITDETPDYTFTEVGIHQATLKITDSANPARYLKNSITIEVFSPQAQYDLNADPAEITVLKGDMGSVTISGGVLPYTADSEDFYVAAANAKNNIVTIFATGEGSTNIKVKDSSGGIVVIPVTVIAQAQPKVTSLTVSPTAAVLTVVGETLPIRVSAGYDDGKTGAPGEVKWTSDKPGIVSVDQSGIATAVSDGKATITADVDGITATLSITVDTAPAALEIRPSVLVINVNETRSVSVYAIYKNGDTKPISNLLLDKNFNGISINGYAVTGLSAGFGEISATSGNITAKAVVKVTSPLPLSLDPPSLRLIRGETAIVTITGGLPPFTVETGEIAESDDRTWMVTAPDKAGDYVYAITDASASKTQLSIKVYDAFSLQADTPYISTNESTAITPMGGTSPYRWKTTGGDLSASESSDNTPVVYTSPSAEGKYTVSALDADGLEARIAFTTVRELFVSPAELFMTPNSERAILVTGGLPPYEGLSESGELEKSGDSAYLYTSPSVHGKTSVTIRDAAGTKVTVTVNVISELAATPQKAVLKAGEAKTFQIFGGFGEDNEIFVVTLAGAAAINPVSGEIAYTAPNVTGNDVIYIYDRSGQEEEITIDVTGEEMFLSPSSITRFPGESVTINAVMAEGDVTFEAEAGDINVLEDGSAIEYTLPEVLGEYTVTAKDQAGRSAKASVFAVSESVLISPLESFADPGETITLTALRGAGGYQYKVTDGTLEPLDAEDGRQDILYYTPSLAGEYFITVMDRAGAYARAKVTVTRDMDIFESDRNVYMGDITKGGKNMELSVRFPYYDKDVDIWVVIFGPGVKNMNYGPTHFLEAGGNLFTDDGFTYPMYVSKPKAPIQEVIWKSFDPCEEKKKYEGTWGVFWAVVPSQDSVEGNVNKLLNMYSLGANPDFYWFDVVCPDD